MTAPGVKHDHGKPRCGLALLGFSRALLEVARVGTYGAAKYTDTVHGKAWIEERRSESYASHQRSSRGMRR